MRITEKWLRDLLIQKTMGRSINTVDTVLSLALSSHVCLSSHVVSLSSHVFWRLLLLLLLLLCVVVWSVATLQRDFWLLLPFSHHVDIRSTVQKSHCVTNIRGHQKMKPCHSCVVSNVS